MHLKRVTVFIAIVLGAIRPAIGWSNKEHLQLTRISALRLIEAPDTPQDMKQWLRDAMPGITDMEAEKTFFLNARVGPYPNGAVGLGFWATVPDLDVATARSGGPEKKVEPFGVSERILHYIDIEFFNPNEARRIYTNDLSTKPRLEDVPRDMNDKISYVAINGRRNPPPGC